MNLYEISAHIDGIKKTRTIFASSKAEAEKIGWELFDADSIYVSEKDGDSNAD